MTLQKRLKEAKMVAEVISPTMLAVVSTLAVGAGIVLKNSDDIYDIGRLFVDYVDRYNDTVGDVISVFSNSVKVLSNGIVKVESPFLNIVKDFFDNVFGKTDKDISFVDTLEGSLPYFSNWDDVISYVKSVPPFLDGLDMINDPVELTRYGITLKPGLSSVGKYVYIDFYYNGEFKVQCKIQRSGSIYNRYLTWVGYGSKCYILSSTHSNFSDVVIISQFDIVSSDVVTLPYGGSYDWDNNIEDKKQGTGDLPLPIPGNVGDLVGKNPSDVWDKNYENGLVGNGDITVPDVSNPSIGLGGSTSFPVEDNTDGSIDIEYNKTVWSNGDLITADKLNNIEDALEALCTTTENYIKTIWKDNDLITEEKLNKIENAIAVLSPSYEKTNWSNGDIIIAELLNKIENAIEAL